MALIFRNSILIAERRDQSPTAPAWEFPGGKVEPGETLREALLREAREELGIELQKVESFMSLPQKKLDGTFWSLTLFYSYVPDQRVENKEHRQVRWVETQDLKQVAFMPSNLGFIDPLLVLFQSLRKKPI
ncbi:MAG: NUDIX domain-containing protein [Bdellovibrionales bacterium]